MTLKDRGVRRRKESSSNYCKLLTPLKGRSDARDRSEIGTQGRQAHGK